MGFILVKGRLSMYCIEDLLNSASRRRLVTDCHNGFYDAPLTVTMFSELQDPRLCNYSLAELSLPENADIGPGSYL